jgi:hypothetical protein
MTTGNRRAMGKERKAGIREGQKECIVVALHNE